MGVVGPRGFVVAGPALTDMDGLAVVDLVFSDALPSSVFVEFWTDPSGISSAGRVLPLAE